MRSGLRSSGNGVSVDGEGDVGRKRKRVECPIEKDDDDGGGVVSSDVVNSESDLCSVKDSEVSLPEVEVKGRISEGEPLGCGNFCTNTTVEGNANGEATDANGLASKGSRGRKRKNSELSGLVEGDEKRLEVILLDALSQVNRRVLRSRCVAGANGGGTAVPKENVGEKTESEIEQVDKKKIKMETDADVIVQSNRQGMEKKKGRGRPRKVNLEKGASGVLVDGKDYTEGFTEQKEKRMLKAESVTNNSQPSESCKSYGTDSNEESGISDREEKQLVRDQIVEMLTTVGKDADVIVQPNRRGRKKKKDRRGRPSKMKSKEEASGVLVDKKDNTEGFKKQREKRHMLKAEPITNDSESSDSCKSNGNENNEEGAISRKEKQRLVRDQKVEMLTTVEKDADVIVQPNRRGRKKKKGLRGRPSKLNSEKGASRVLVDKKDNTKGFKRKREKSNKLKAESTTNNCKSSKSCKSNGTESNEESGIGRKEEKQLVRDQIVEMLTNAGWTIEYRPRIDKPYNDAVYIDRAGRGHWSVTKAYRMLKERIDKKIADAVEIAAFHVVPDEVMSKLFRVVTNKRNDFGIKKRKGVASKKLLKNKSLGKKKVDAEKAKEKSNLFPKSRGGKPRAKPDEGRNKRRFALLPRGSGNGSNPDRDGFVLYDGKRSLLSWMVDSGTVPQSGKVQYMNPRMTRVLLEGQITCDGIRCSCCSDMHSVLDFESHAGSKLKDPWKNIHLKSGPSLLQCLSDTWSKQEKIHKIGFCSVDIAGDDPNDDTCNICGDGGDLICCDGCPSTFHQSCLDIQHFPAGDWRCVFCSCKFCGTIGGNTSRIDELFTCQLCEEKFHIPCIEREGDMLFYSEVPSFCGEGCQKLFNHLQELLGIRHELNDGYSWTLLQRRDVGSGALLCDDPLKVECNAKLAVAFSVMDECFVPIVDQRSKSNMIHNVVYSCGSNVKRLNYSGFYTVILERGDETVAAASIRIHGTQLAEMPFIATRYRYRRQGMCRRLLTAIETALSSLNVEKLIIPAISELIKTWTGVFGFMPLEESKRREMRFMSMIVFPGTDMLQKPLQKHQLASGQTTSAAGSDGPELTTENGPKAEDKEADDWANKYGMKCVSGSDSYASAEAEIEDDEADAAIGPEDSLNEGDELRTESGPTAPDQTTDELLDEHATKCSSMSDPSKVRATKSDEADAAVATNASIPASSTNGASDIRNATSKEPVDKQSLNLNASANKKYTAVAEIPALDDPLDALKTCQSAKSSSPTPLHFGDKIVKCIQKLIQQGSH